MCKIGDIIVVRKYIGDDGKIINKQHSFIVIDDNSNQISGLKYDMVANVMSSFRDDKHKKKKLKYKENLEITSDDIVSENKNNKSGYIKADQLFYFEKSRLDYYVFAHVESELLDELLKLIIELEVENRLKNNLKNIEKQTN